MNPSTSVFIHLSDIHFKKETAGQIFDFDLDIRNELKIDAKTMINKFPGVTGILVTGDIAYSGLESEYDYAQNWITELCDNINCKYDHVWLIPGNHDVNRNAVKENPHLEDFHKLMRLTPTNEIDNQLNRYLKSKESVDVLIRGLVEYNKFASKYGCSFLTGKPWKYDITLNDGSTLRLCGINSAFISDEYDNDTDSKLILGGFQRNSFLRQDGVEYMVLCHHPPQWLRDEDDVVDMLNARVRVQLFGHKHKHKVDRVNDVVRLSSGAVHPDRMERAWVPRYNWLEIYVGNVDQNRYLELKVYSRIWDDINKRFKPDFTDKGEEAVIHKLPLEDWNPPPKAKECSLPDADSDTGIQTNQSDHKHVIESSGICEMSNKRELAFKYLSLSYDSRLTIAQKLNLIENDDEDVKGTELFLRIIKRAEERNLFKELWDLVANESNEGTDTENPF